MRIGIARIVVGASTFQPVALGRHLIGVSDEQQTGPAVFFTRAFGIRNIALGAWVLATLDQPRAYRRTVYQVNAAIDAADMAILAFAAATRGIPKRFLALSAFLGTNACLAFLQLATEV